MSVVCAVITSQQYLSQQTHICRLFSFLSIMFHEKKSSTGHLIDLNTKSEAHNDIQQITFPFYRRQFHSLLCNKQKILTWRISIVFKIVFMFDLSFYVSKYSSNLAFVFFICYRIRFSKTTKKRGSMFRLSILT